MPRQKSKDPIQEHLRQHKENWNKACSEFISRLIAFKKGLNGRGDASYSLPPSNIKEPLPSEVSSFLNQITSDFNKIINSANSIVSEQDNYSKVRKKKQVKASTDLDKFASGKLSRFLTYFTSLFSSDKYKRYRVGMLKICVDLEKGFNEFENKVLIRGLENIPDITKKYQDIRYEFEILKDYYKTFKNTAEQNIGNVLEKEKQKQQISKDKDDLVKRINQDSNYFMDLGIKQSFIYPLRIALKEYKLEQSVSKKEIIADKIVDEYNKIIDLVNKAFSEKYGPVDISTLEEAADIVQLKGKQACKNNEIIKTAHNVLTRWLRKELVKAMKLDKTSAIRLDIADKIDIINKKINELMDHLEKELNVVFIDKKIDEIDELIKSLHQPINSLNSFYKEYFYKKEKYQERGRDRDSKHIFENILTKRIKKDLETDID